jgi:type IV pilus biogenesis protein CpaD/CtpE
MHPSYPKLRRGLLIVVAVTAAQEVSGCTDYLARRDTLTLGTGEAAQSNIAVHVIDPSPPASNRIFYDINGERLQHGIERYRNPQTTFGGGGGGVAPVLLGSPSSIGASNR